jgi:alpha-ketoglutarate-dependent taurine dioxygenase
VGWTNPGMLAEDLSEGRLNEGQAILPFLLAHASSPNYTVGFGWNPGDFVIWDNQATWHFAVNDYQGPRAYRKVVGG